VDRCALRIVCVILLGLLAACGGPQAWTDYKSPEYDRLDAQLLTGSHAPIEIKGELPGLSQADLLSLIRDALKEPGGSVQPSQGTTLRTAWMVSSHNDGGALTAHVRAEYYRNGGLITSAQGEGPIAGGAADPNLRLLINGVAEGLLPVPPHQAPGRG
jgi:hypothetical protein